MNRLFPILFVVLISVTLHAQEGGDSRSSILRRSNEAAMEYRSRMAQERGAFLRRAWTASDESAPIKDPFRREAEAGRAGHRTEDPRTEPAGEDVPSGSGFALTYYGAAYRFETDLPVEMTLPSISEGDVADAWESLSGGAIHLLEDCLSIRSRERLGDWAYLQLVDSLSVKVFPFSRNERELLFGFLLGKSGYKMRFGRNEGGLTCLYGTAQVIYGKPYFFEDGIHYYRHREGEGSLSLSDGVPEGDRALDLRMTDAPAISGGSVHERRIEVGDISFDYRISQRLLDFYAGYPHTEMYVKAGAPVSTSIRESVYPALQSAIDGLGEVDATRVILRFVQKLMEHRSDDERWGFEKWNFPEESLFYRCGDCDDHTILFARLVRDLLGLDVLLVSCEVNGSPHATTAVRFSEPLEGGDWIQYGGERYYCCEPSSTSADVGDRCWERYVVKSVDRVE